MAANSLISIFLQQEIMKLIGVGLVLDSYNYIADIVK